jgi:single-stranded-DNA-specific exonuclease
MAAGFTVATDRLDALASYLAERLRDQAPIAAAPLYLDGTLAVSGATDQLAEQLTRIGPFGSGNPEPRFVVPHLRVVQVGSIGLQHLRCTFADSASQQMQGIAFRSAKAPLGLALSDRAGAPVHVAGRLQLRRRRGGLCLQFVIDDAAAVF